MNEVRNTKIPKLLYALSVAISVVTIANSILLIIGLQNDTNNRQISYDTISPHVEDYLVKNNILDDNGLIAVPVPSTSGEIATKTIEQAVDELIATGKFDYLRGEKGDTGATGATGAAGAAGEAGAQGVQGEQGIPGTAVEKGDKGDKGDQGEQGIQGNQGEKGDKGDQGEKGDQGDQGDPGDPGVLDVGTGLTLSGGTLSLKPCAVGQVLSVASNLRWDCATVSADGVATTNVSAQLTLAGTSLQASITDSNDNTINASPIDLGNTFATDTELSNALTTAIANLTMAQYITEQELTDEIDNLNLSQYITGSELNTAVSSATSSLVSQTELASAIAGLNLSQFATTANLGALTTRVGALETSSADHTSRIATLETNAINYVTDSSLATSLGNYYLKTQTYTSAQTNNLLLGKQDKLPLCTDGQVVKFDFATSAWVCGDDEDTHVNLSTYASQSWVTGRIAANNDNYTTTTDLTTLLASKANTTALTTVSNNLANNYTSTAALQLLLDDKQDEFPTCSSGQILKYTNGAWACGSDAVGSVNLSGYATEAWVLAQNYASTSAVSSLSGMLSGVDLRVVTLENAGYVTASSLNTYLETADLSSELLTRLHAGVGVSITNNDGVFTINALAQTDVYEIVNGHEAVATPGSNKIYIDVATTPVTQWVYEGMSWTKIGEVSFDTSNFYTKSQTEAAISNAVTLSATNYTTTTDLATLLSGKVDQSTFNSLSSRVFAVEGAGYITTAALNGYLETSSLAAELSSRLIAGNGVNIVNNNGVFTFTATGGDGSGGGSGGVYEIVNDHTTVASPDVNKIYIDFSTDPAEQWIYDGSSWQIIGQISFDLDNYYTKTQTDAMVGGAIVANNANYTTSANLTALLAAKANQSSLSVTDSRVTALEGAGYITSSALNGYLKTADLSVELNSRLAAGEGIEISNNGGVFTIDSVAETDVYEVVDDHTLVIGPHDNKIYIDIATDPAEQWVYEGGVWRLVGQVNFDIADYYTKTETDTAIADAISTNSADYTTTSALNVLLAAKANSADLVATNNNLASNYTTTNATAALLLGKQDKLPTCASDQVIKYDSDAAAWVCADDMNTQVNLAGYATQTWASGQITAQLASYTTTTDLDTLLEDKADASALAALGTSLANNYTTTNALTNLLADKQDNLPVCLDGQVLKYDISLGTDNWVCAEDEDTHVDLNNYTTEGWVTGEIAANNDSYTTTTDLNALLLAKADQTALDATNTALATETTNRQNADTGLSGRLDTIETDYLKSTDLSAYATTDQISDMATEDWTNEQGFLKSADLANYADQNWVNGRGYVTATTLNTTLADYVTTTDFTTATTDMETKASATATYVQKSALNCSATQVLTGTGTGGTVNCRAIMDITSGTLTSSANLVTANTLRTVVADYYTKAEIDTMNIVTGASQGYQIEVVTTLPANPSPNTLYVILGS